MFVSATGRFTTTKIIPAIITTPRRTPITIPAIAPPDNPRFKVGRTPLKSPKTNKNGLSQYTGKTLVRQIK